MRNFSNDNRLKTRETLDRELVGQIAIANKECDYNQRDQETIARLAEYYSQAIQRVRTQGALKLLRATIPKTIEIQERIAATVLPPSPAVWTR